MDHDIYIQSTVLEAFDYFNAELFASTLPPVIINFSRQQPKSFGYFSVDRWKNNKLNNQTHEISLNPIWFVRGLKHTYATLVHEMVHLWQMEFGKNPPKSGYHNKEWAEKMKQVGLMPSNTGAEGGKETGANCSHYIIEGAKYESCYFRLPDSAILNYESIEFQKTEKSIKKRQSKTKYSCTCGFNCWAKPDAQILCGNCSTVKPVKMQCEE